jgi:antitoxin HigA-1
MSRYGSWAFFTQQRGGVICESPQGIGWKRYPGRGKVNTASGSMPNGESVSCGRMLVQRTWRSWTTTREIDMSSDLLPPIHPGEVLLEDFLVPMGLSQYRLAKDISVPPRRINEIVHGKRGISADTALRLARYFGTSEFFWLNLQTHYQLEIERDRLGARLDDEVQPLALTG